MTAIMRFLGRWVPQLSAAVRVADTTAEVLTQTHTLLSRLDTALKDGRLNPNEVRVLRQEAARLRSQIEVVSDVFHALYDD